MRMEALVHGERYDNSRRWGDGGITLTGHREGVATDWCSEATSTAAASTSAATGTETAKNGHDHH